MMTLLDTNVLVHAHNRASPHQAKASRIVSDAVRMKLRGCITPQILYEFFAVITSPRRVEHPLNASDAAAICDDLYVCRQISKIFPSATTPSRVFDLARQLRLVGSQVFDCAIALTAEENGVRRIYTENTADFQRYDFLTAINPFE